MVVSVCFAELLRFSEMANVKLADISVNSGRTTLSFRVRQAKNLRSGFTVDLPVTDRRHCVGAFMLDFLERGLKWKPGKIGYLCCALEGKNFSPRIGISYSTLHSSCGDLIESAGLDPTVYSTHSAKHGGATAAVAAGCTDAELTALGRWRSANTGSKYVIAGASFRKNLSARFSL